MIDNSDDTLLSYIRQQRFEYTLTDLPLKGLRVIDLATVVAAPFAATILGDMGAEVIKIERPDMQDALRAWGVIEDKDIHPFWSVFGRNKYPITLNLKSSRAKEIFTELLVISDVLIENMRPGTLDRIGFDTETLLKINPGLIIGKISGYGQTGPYSKKPGFGTLAEGFSGYTYLNAQPQGTPTNPPMALADCLAGLNLAIAILVALRSQERGKNGGQVIDVSLYEPLFSLLGADFLSYHLTKEIPQPTGNELSYIAPRNSYRTLDRQWVAMSCSAQKPFERLMECVGRPEFIEDPRFLSNDIRTKPDNRRVLNEVIAEWIGKHEMDEVLEICDRQGITIGPITNMQDIDQNAHYNERGSFIEIDDPATGIPLKIPNMAYRMLGTPGKIRFPGLPHGSANNVILEDLLGFSEEEIETLKTENAI